MINVLQEIILTDKERMVLTPTFHLIKMYVPFQDSTSVPLSFDAGTYVHAGVTLPRVDALPTKTLDGKLVVGVTNLDPEYPLPVARTLQG